ncbi:MAG: histidine kinase dimerization/phospho-acceptor domain-containing protein, partial [Bacteroidota bacterium]
MTFRNTFDQLIERTNSRSQLLTVRLAYFVASFSMVVYSIWFNDLHPEHAAPYWDRWILCSFNFVCFWGTFVPRFQRPLQGTVLYVLLCLFSIDLGYINYLHGFHHFHFINTFVSLQICFLLIRDTRWLQLYFAITAISLFLALILTPQILIGNVLTLSGLIAIGLGLNYQIQDGRLNQQEKILKVDQKLHRLSLVAEKTTNGVVILDAMGRFEWVNKTFEKVSGFQSEEVIGKRPMEVLSGPNTSLEEIKTMQHRLAQGKPYEGEILYYSKDGRERWQVLTINPVLDEQGIILNYIVIETDINARKKMENQLREAKEEAIAAASAKAEFLANMSHEIRTPMNAVIGMTGLLADSTLTEEQKDYVETIRVSGDNLLTVINDILDFSKIDSGKLELERQAFNLVDSVEDVLDMLSTKAHDKHLELMYELEPGVPHGIIGDPTRLNQILVNLVNNAIKFTDQGSVTLSVRCASSTDPETRLQKIRFQIEDTGVGMSPDQVKKIF